MRMKEHSDLILYKKDSHLQIRFTVTVVQVFQVYTYECLYKLALSSLVHTLHQELSLYSFLGVPDFQTTIGEGPVGLISE